MKFTLPILKRGDIVEARLVEKVNDSDLIADFRGDLIRISNKTKRPFKVGQKIPLRVIQVSPLAFQLVEKDRRRSLDVSV